MSNNEVMTLTIKGIGDFSDVVSNVGSVQKALTKLKLPDKLGDSLNKNISNFMKEYDKYQAKIAEGIHTQGDQNAVNKSLNSMLNSYEKIIKDFSKISEKDFKDIFNLDEGAFASFQKRIRDIQTEIKKIKIDPKQLAIPMDNIMKLTKAKAVSGNGKGLDKIKLGLSENDFSMMKEGLAEVIAYYDRFQSKMTETKRIAMKDEIEKLKTSIEPAAAAMDHFEKEAEEAQQQINDLGQKASSEMREAADALNKTGDGARSVTEELKKVTQEEFNFNRQAADIGRQVQNMFGLSQMIRKVGDIARDAFTTVKDLDKAMTETAVVTNFDIGDMWDMLPTYTAQANQLGSTIKDVYEAATLYYQQGLNTNQAMGLANETLKMARIAGLDATEATNMMTAALRGFNMEVNQTSAQKINDIYSELAAITASDTKEIGSAMERTASIANAANMDFATTSAFLAQMIETTREAPENLGTAMKTIVARFQEMKEDPTKLVDSEGIAMDVNKVDKALKTIGVNLTNTKGEFRDLDDVFLDISAKWDSLSQGQQRYIATIAAGSRQQSRFIAMMSNYERTMELVDAANNSAGASQRQFEKTLDSMAAKLNMLKNAWDQFTMGLMNNQILKFGVDALTTGFTIVNKFIDILGKIPPKPFEGITKSILTLVSTLALLQVGGKGTMGLTTGVFSWAEGKGFKSGFKNGWSTAGAASKISKTDKTPVLKAKADAAAYKATIQKEMANNGFLKAVGTAWKTKGKNFEFTNTFQAAFGQFSGERFAASWSSDIENEITRVLNSVIDDAAKIGEVSGREFKQNLIKELKSGEIGGEQLISSVEKVSGKKIGNLGVNAKEINNGAQAAENFGQKINFAGEGLLRFGTILEGTPLAPFGTILSTIGMTVMQLGTAITWASNSFMIGMGKVVAAEGMGVAATKLLAGGFKQLWIDMGPVGWAILAITALASAYMLLKDKIPTKGNQLNWATDAAAAASEAYDSAKQETSELADAISKIQETDSAFDGLVAGTAEFNEQLVTANEQIMALIDKYPMLNDSRYLSTDKNGRMRINQAGLDAVQEYQKQIQANASAMNLIQTADLNAIENQQKADELRKPKGGMTTDELEKNRKQADLLEQRIEAETQLARQNAIRISLADKELHNAETMAKIMADQYETKKESAKLDVEAMSKHERRQAYADYHGYTYDKSTKKIKDVEGNEVDYDDEAIKDEVIEQQVILEFQEDAESLERALSSVNTKFASGLEEQTAGSAHVISDILSNNIETDEEMLRKVLSEPNQLQNLVDNLSEAEMAAILGISASSITDETIGKYKTDIINKLTNNAEKIAEAQSESYSDLAAMMAKAQGNILDKNGDIIGQKGNTTKQIEQAISKQINDLKPEYAHLMSSVGSQLQEFAGEDTMAAFVNAAYDIYNAQGEEAGQTINELNGLIDETNFDSAISRLTFYNKAIQSENKSIQNLGQTMRATTGEANLLGQAFDEFLGSSDWAELSENADDFKNSIGEYDAAGIQKAAEQSRTLNELLKTGAISAGGVAAALQGMDDGTITNLNSTVLTLLSSFNRLADAVSEAHKVIEGFDPGIDTGEGEDFVKENAEKFKEYYDNGEFGNEQLQNYIKLAAGTDKWNEALRENGGNLRETAKDLQHYVTAFDDGFVSVYDNLTKGLDLEGNNISDDVKKEFEGLQFLWDENDELQINLGEFGTEELQTYLQKALGISEEYAKLMLQNLANYDTKLSTQLRANDIKKSLSNRAFQESHQDSQGKFILSDSDIRAVGANLDLKEDINTKEGLEEAAQAMEKLAGVELEIFRTQNEDGTQREDYGQLLADYAKTFYGQNVEDLFGVQELQQGGKFDVGKLINDSMAKGMDSNQASQTAYEAIQKASAEGITDLLYNGQLLDLSEINSYEDFLAATQKLTDSAQWYEVGQSIAEGIISYIEGKDQGEPKGEGSQTPKSDSDTSSSVKKSQTNPGNSVGAYDTGSGKKSNWENNVPGWMSSWFKKVSEDYNNPKSSTSTKAERQPLQKLYDLFIKGPRAEQQARQEQNQTAAGKSSTTSTDDASKAASDTSTAAENTTNAATALSNSATSLNTSATALSNAANKLSQNNIGNNNSTPSAPVKQYAPGAPSNIPPNQNLNQQGTIEVDNSDANSKLNETKQLAIDTKETINQGAKFTITTPGASSLNKAAKSAQKITDNSGSKSISVTASGLEDTQSLTTAVGDFKKLKNDSVKLTVKVSGLSDLTTAISKVNSFYNLRDDKVTLTTKHENKATGAYNHGYVSAPPKAGSAARGSYGQLGPKGKGGMTLTGELGYEIAWIPSESRSMILGANGPQMVNLPGDAVVWTHEQSKQIMKQKSIPAGSHANTSIKRPGSGGGGGGNNSTSSKAAKQSLKAANTGEKAAKKAGKVSVYWENLAHKNEALQRKMDKNQKLFEKLLKAGGTTQASIAGAVDEYKKSLNQIISLNQEAMITAQGSLNKLDSGKKVKVSYKSGKKTKTTKINTKEYIDKDPTTGAYVINQAAISKKAGKNKELAKAIKAEAEKQIKDYEGKYNSAEDAVTKATEALAQLADDTYTAFHQWEKTITQVYLLGQRLEQLTKQRDIYEAAFDSEIDRLSAHFGNAEDSLPRIRSALNHSNELLISQLDAQSKLIQGTYDEYANALDLTAYRKKTIDANPESQEAKNDYAMREATLQFLSKIGITDMSKFDYSTAIQELEARGYNEKSYNQIKEGLDDIKSIQDGYYSSIEDTYKKASEIYSLMNEYQSFISEFEGNLLDGMAEQTEAEINRLDKLNTALAKAMKELLDEVKRKLDERRQKEDNQKTESDISKKQQRLAALRADTSGGHATEIAQLEKEIAEARQNYGRTLEDQLIEKLQNQADIAEKQRERQIELLEGQKELAEKTGTNLEQVRKWLQDPKANYEQIREAYFANAKYDEAPPGEQEKIEAQFEADFAKYMGYSEQLKALQTIDEHVKAILDRADDQAGVEHIDREKTQKELVSVNEKLTKEQETKESLQKDLGEAQSNLDSLEQQRLEASKQLASAEERKKETQKAYGAAQNQYQAALQSGDENQIAAAGAKLRQARTDHIKAKRKAEEARNNVAQFDAPIAQAKANVDSIKSKIAETDTNIKNLEQQKTELEDLLNTQGELKEPDIKLQEETAPTTASASANTASQDLASMYQMALHHFPFDMIGAGGGNGFMREQGYDELLRIAQKLGYNERQVLSDLVNIHHGNWEPILNGFSRARMSNRIDLERLVATFPSSALQKALNDRNIIKAYNNKFKHLRPLPGMDSGEYRDGQIVGINGQRMTPYDYLLALVQRYHITPYKTGGIADFTGPAWLDGTPSKPELVLNATDTKNFIALKDVLSRAMSSVGHVENSYGGNANFEININVDRISNDYDVNKVVDQVEKRIVQKSGYRNVTQVRNFR